jgi:hypothetical protein
MKCYFNGRTDECGDGRGGLVSFAIPDLGVLYRVRQEGSPLELEYKSLIALLNFLKTNEQLISYREFDIQGDSIATVFQLAGRLPTPSEMLIFHQQIQRFRKSLRFNVSWLPGSLNRAAHGIPDLPPIDLELSFDFAPNKESTASGVHPFTQISAKM